MAIVLITEALMGRSGVSDGTILRDRMLSGFCVRMNARKRTFRVATSVAGKPFRMNLGYWPLMSVGEARSLAMQVLAQCRRGERPARPAAPIVLPTLRELHADYCRVKGIKASSQKRYVSFYRTQFNDWLDRPDIPILGRRCLQPAGACHSALRRGRRNPRRRLAGFSQIASPR